MSSRMAACGQPPVSTARIRSGSSAWCFVRNSPSSLVKMSFVTAAMFSAFAQPPAQLQHQRGFAAADRAADADREGAPAEIAVERQVALVKMAGMIGMWMAIAVVWMK